MPDMWKHKTRGTVYERIGGAELQNAGAFDLKEGDVLTIYMGSDGKLWARPVREFHDGRFEQIQK